MTTLADMQSQVAQQPAAGPDPDPNAAAQAPAAPPKTIFHVERESLGEGMGEMWKPFRRFYGMVPKGMDLEKVEVEWDSQDENVPSEVWLVPAGFGDVPGGAGSSDRLKDGRILTFAPESFGTEQDRIAAGKGPLKRLSWEEHNYVEPDFDAPPAPPAPEGP